MSDQHFLMPNKPSVSACARGISSVCPLSLWHSPSLSSALHSISSHVLLIQQCSPCLQHTPTAITLVFFLITSFWNYCNCLSSNHSASSLCLLRSLYSQLVESFSPSTALIIPFPGLKNINGSLIPASQILHHLPIMCLCKLLLYFPLDTFHTPPQPWNSVWIISFDFLGGSFLCLYLWM